MESVSFDVVARYDWRLECLGHQFRSQMLSMEIEDGRFAGLFYEGKL